MNSQDDKNKQKTKLIIITFLAIIAVLVAGIIYQFITIKGLKRAQENNAIIEVIDNETLNSFDNYYALFTKIN